MNGDVTDYDYGVKYMKNLDGFMIGRASFGNPWCFVKGGYKPTLEEVLAMMEFHAKKLVETK
jgi:tRNA-dihydrouridine synthase